MSSQFNKGSQIITWDFKNPAKARYFDRLNRNVIKPGVYSGLTINFAGHTVSLSTGAAVLNCSFEALDFLQIKVDFETSYSFSEQIYPSMTESKEIIYLEYQYAEVTENFVDIKHMSSSQYFLSPVENSIIVGELLFDIFNNIIGIDYSNKTWGMVNADIDHGFPDTTYYFNTITQTKKWKTTGVLLPSGTKELQYVPFNESIGRILTTSPTNTTPIENKMSIGSTEESTSPSTGAIVLAGGLGVAKSAVIGDRLSANKFYGRVPLGGVIPVIGVFSSSANAGTFTSAFIPSSGVITDDGFQRCDGSIINNGSSLFNGKYTPDITDSRFIQGSTSAGGLGGGGNNGNNTHTISTSNLPTHTHDISHSHSGTTGTESSDHSHGGTTQGAGDHFHAYAPYGISVSFNEGGAGNFRLPYTTNGDGAVTHTDTRGSHAHGFGTGGRSDAHSHYFGSTTSQNTYTSGDGGFSNTAIDIRPKYINAVYLMRVI